MQLLLLPLELVQVLHQAPLWVQLAQHMTLTSSNGINSRTAILPVRDQPQRELQAHLMVASKESDSSRNPSVPA